MKGKKKVLGRGLDALLGKNDGENILESNISKDNKFSEILLSKISSNPFQPRKSFKKETIIELANSIKSQGIIQPITVRKINNNKYQLISGERRVRACKLAGIEKIPVYIIKADEQKMLEMGLIENIQRLSLIHI